MGLCVAGIDGGGTHTRALLLARDGTRVGRAEGPASLVRPDRPAEAARVAADLVRRAAAAADIPLPLPALWAGLAGAGPPGVRREVEAALRAEQVAGAVAVGTDVEAALHDAFGGGPGIILVAGTGSVLLGTGEDGRSLQVGGWGRVMGDQGSGYHIGASALRAVGRALDGRASPTPLSGALLALLDLSEPRALGAWAEAATKAEIAALAPHVVRHARAGDRVARAVVRHAADELHDQLTAAMRALFEPEASPRVALNGGLIGPRGPLRREAEELVARAGGRLSPGAVMPERGAARLALALLR